MGTKLKLKQDFVAEIDLSRDEFIKTFSEILREKFNLETKRVTSSTDAFLSENPNYSFVKVFINAIPAQMQWSAKEITPTQCYFDIIFSLPALLKLRVYIAMILLGAVCYAAKNVILWVPDAGLPYNFTLLIWLTAWIFFIGLLLLACSFLCILGILSWRYLLFLNQILQEILTKLNKNIYHIHENVSVIHKAVVGSKMFFSTFIIGAFVSGVSYKDIFKIVAPKIQIVLLVFVIVLLLVILITRRKLMGLCKAVKASPVAFNCLFTICIIFFLYSTTYITESTMEDASYKVQRLRTTAEEIEDPDLVEKIIKSSTTNKNEVIAWIWFSLILFYTSLFAIWVAFFCVFLLFSELLKNFLAGQMGGHHETLERVFNTNIETETNTSSTSLKLSPMALIAIWFMFFALSASCWGIVLNNFSIFTAFIIPGFQITPFSNGEATVKAAKTFASLLLWNAGTTWSIYSLSLFLLLPTLLPSFLFVYLNFKVLLRSFKKTYIPVPYDSNAVKKTNMIASKMGISKISCLLNEQSNILSPYAKFTGWFPRNKIVFTHRGLKFLENHPEHAEAILAHEIAHLKNDCKTIWRLGILSRIGLVGAGFLSVLHDSIAMEDRADDASRHYLRKKGMNENLLTEAAFMLEAETYFEKETHKPQPLTITFGLRHNMEHTANLQIKDSLLRKTAQAFHAAYDFYFRLEFYDYLHREARYRRALQNTETA